jgi:hypothetical protein
MSSIFPVNKAHHFEMHNIKEGHHVKASVSDTFVNYVEAFKKTKTAKEKKKLHKFKMQAKINYRIP